MAKKKDFTKVIAEATQEPQEAQEKQAKPRKQKERKTYTDAEAAEFLQNMKTTGRKGVKLPRINLAFAPDLYEYAQTMARAAGISYTEFVNSVLRQHMNEHADTFKKAIEFRKSL